MFAVLFFFFTYWVLCEILAELLPPLFRGIGYAFRFLAECLVTAFCALAKTSFRGLIWLFTWLWRRSIPAAQFLYFLLEEILCGSSEEETENEDEQPVPALERFETARTLLGLPPSFTQAEFKTAYRRAIRAAHPDLQGSDEDAQAVNAAREIIKMHFGW